MDAFLAKLSHHATSYAIRSCLALTSTYVIQHGSKLLKTVEDDPLRDELSHLQRRLARKIELISPILETIEFRYARGNSTLEAVARTAQELRANIDSLGKRLAAAALADDSSEDGQGKKKNSAAASARRIELQSIATGIKQLIVDIDDSIPLINLWVSAIGGIQAQPSAFSPSRLLQASMLVNVGDTQYILNPHKPMQIGPDFVLSLYMLFRAYASPEDTGEPYGVEEGQRKPVWQEVVHKARVRLHRVPLDDRSRIDSNDNIGGGAPYVTYAYQLQIVEDLDDGRVHTVEDGYAQPSSYDGVPSAGIREIIPVRQISKMFYADVGRILNIKNEDGASSSPVLLLKRDSKAQPPNREIPPDIDHNHIMQPRFIENPDESILSDDTLEGDTQDEINCQLLQESQVAKAVTRATDNTQSKKSPNSWRLPQDLDPEWIALEVFEMDDDDDSEASDENEPSPSEDGEDDDDDDEGYKGRISGPSHLDGTHHLKRGSRPSADPNLVTQLNRMSLASTSSRSSSRSSGALVHGGTSASDEDLLEKSPFGAIQTSLSLLEMMLRLTSLQEFEQTTHLAIPDHVLRFYLDESASRADADAPVHGAGGGRN